MTRRKSGTKKSGEATEVSDGRRRVTLLGILLIAIPLMAFAWQVHRTRPFVDDVPMALNTGDDWFQYKRLAREILRGDLLLVESRPKEYGRPAGFLYGYFVAAVFAVLGQNSTMVYIVQGTLLGVGIVILFLAFESYFPRWMLYIVLGTQVLLMRFELGPWFSMRMLSEDLLCILVPWAMFFLVRAYQTESVRDLVLAGVFTGLCHLARANAILMMPFGAIILGIYLKKYGKSWRRGVALFLLGLALSQAPLIGRNIYVARRITPQTISPLFAKYSDWAFFTNAFGLKMEGKRRRQVAPAKRTTREPAIWQHPKGIQFMVYRALFISGIRTYDGMVVHWIALWAGALLFVALSLRRRRLEYQDALLIAMIGAIIGPVLFGGALNSYGARFVIAGMPLVLMLGFRGVVLALPSSWHAEA